MRVKPLSRLPASLIGFFTRLDFAELDPAMLFTGAMPADFHTLVACMPCGYANATLTVSADEFHQLLEEWFSEIPERILKCGIGVDP